ncbi:DEAD/DEAH box helicase [Desulfobacula sp.]|uniref:DEAD/DEAH box helicase n=1 Tax=Desulfobacula sp. TaxID=2593537 RepID=UPI002639A661|nr:DEAD/DEAH box helicase [Desulfobacula sp.]
MSDSLLLQLPNTFRAFYGGFAGLHNAQRSAVAPILQGHDVILQAATGSGKSEAVLAPCLERVIRSGRETAVLYIIPTRALAMDLKRRFDAIITERLGLNLAVRTGDTKRSGGKRPDIMFTTPESLDVMLGSANADLKAFLFRVKIVIIDEVHSLIHHYRGRHLVYLFNRLERKKGQPLQKIAMSATIARVASVIDFFGFQENAQPVITSVKRKIRARLLHMKQEESEIPALLNDLYDTWQYRKILIFVNSRVACDRVFGIVNRNGRFQGVSELHYSNLKPLERKRAEKRFRKRSHSLCIATSTLELGIDVGDVDAVLLYQPPGTVAAFLQRIGRANRREQEINFWGLCCGERSGDQVIRFLALLDLAGRGIMESPATRTLPSVLSQQVISCLYEKKRISLASVQSLFPDRHDLLPAVFDSLENKHWLTPSKLRGLFGGGWQYRNHLFEYKIWGNFPEAEEAYILEVSDKAIADIPQSIVAQMTVGDKVFLAGRLLRILKIDTGEQKKVLARPCAGRDEKQLAWIGLGPPVSFEVAEAMGHILKTGEIEDTTCLFSRTRKLFQDAMKQGEKRVVLENGIEVVPGKRALFYYRTFMGSMGNLMLEWSIRENLFDEEMAVASDEMGVECSHWINFQALPLPVDREGFQDWVKRHVKVLRSLVPLNLFCKTLPRNLLIQELTDFLFDHRVARTFAHYLDTSSTIVAGERANLVLETAVQETKYPCAIDIMAGESLLEREQNRMGGPETLQHFLHTDEYLGPCLNSNRVVTLTATMVSDYFFHAQCQRRFCLTFLGLEPPVSNPTTPNNDILNEDISSGDLPSHDRFRPLSRERGIRHEQQIFKRLKEQGATLIPMETTGSHDLRFNAFLEQVNALIEKPPSLDKDRTAPVFLSHCLLKTNDLYPARLDSDKLKSDRVTMKGIGVPDLLILSVKQAKGEKRVIIEVGDIKSSPSPRYHHKWQVAFSAWLLKKIITSHGISARVAKTGFIIIHSSGKSIQKDGFDLTAYLAAFPMLLKNFHSFLSRPAAAADHRLQSHCVSCDWFSSCYHTALESEDIQFLPGLTPGELLKLRQMGCVTMAQIHAAFETISSDNREDPQDVETGFSLEQKRRISGQCAAFFKNQIFLIKKKTRLFPRNMSRAFFIHVKNNPLTGQPWALGWQVTASTGKPLESHVWIMETDQERKDAWQAFSARISTAWEQSICNGKGPHLFHFGSRSRQDLLQWGEAEEGMFPGFFWQAQPSPWTDLRRMFMTHFHMPAPGMVSLFTLGHVFGCTLDIDPPQTLFHHHGADRLNLSNLKSWVFASLSIMVELYAKASPYLTSQWVQEWDPCLQAINPDTHVRALSCLNFIKEEHRLQEEDILTLQELPLEERMLRFRAMGYLRVDHTRLDHEGRFLYLLKISRKTGSSKFRKGDFLRLAPHGMSDIQTGFPVILVEYDMGAGDIAILSRSGKMQLSKHLLYSLEEDTSDWNQAKLTHAATTVFAGDPPHFLQQLLAGQSLERQACESLSWLEKWLVRHNTGLNVSQQRALALPFQYRTSMIQGPPGTGKTHLLGWILIALILQAYEAKRPLRIGVSALTHQAIDTVLKKVTRLVNQFFPGNFPGHCIKWGQTPASVKTDDHGKEDEKNRNPMTVTVSDDATDVRDRPWLILGATGYGFYSLFNSKDKGFPQAFDWIIFDEASQVLVPQALLSLIYGRGNFLFLGDVHQLPPIVRGNYGEYPRQPVGPFLNRSILANFQDIYPESHQETLDITYRMNREICAFPGRTWYNRLLHPAPVTAHARLVLNRPLEQVAENPGLLRVYDKILDPSKPVVLVLTDHQGCSQKSDMEADLMAALAHRLITFYGMSPDKIALISPHRAQNNAIIKRLGKLSGDQPLPCVDTVERVQGAEREVIIFGITSSDPDHLLSDFLNSPNRLNVAMTRARTKLVIMGSPAFFSVIPDSEAMLEKNSCFKQLLHHCQKRNAVFTYGLPARDHIVPAGSTNFQHFRQMPSIIL